MKPTTRLVLPEDVVVAPVAGLPAALIGRVEHEPGDFVVTRAHTRSGSVVVDEQTAALLRYFRSPSTLIDAILAFCEAKQVDPESTLDNAFATLADLVTANLVVPVESSLAQPITPSLPPGSRMQGLEILEAIHLLDDTEVYRVRMADGTIAALKIVGSNVRQNTATSLLHEANVLSRLDGQVNPPLLGAGRSEGRTFVLTKWQSGVDLYRAVAEARALPEPGSNDALLKLAERMLRAYVHLHSQGVLHGDVHPRNVLVDSDDAVTILDFGLALMPRVGFTGLHGGIDMFRAPEVARASLGLGGSPMPSPASEQYSIGALLYFVLTGGHTHAFSLQRDAMLDQLINDPPLSFSHHGAHYSTGLEDCIGRALSKDPQGRYPDLEEMLRSFQHSADGHRAMHLHAVGGSSPGDPGRRLAEEVLDRLRASGPLFASGLEPPTASVTYGASGLAYFLLRVARTRGDHRLLALADQWISRAASDLSSDTAFWNVGRGIVPEQLGRCSLFHHACGVHCVQALIAHARGDEAAQQRAVDRFIAASEFCEHLDVAFGRSGLLIGCAMLLDVAPRHLDQGPLLTLGQRLLQEVWSELDQDPTLSEAVAMTTLGAAHGWCGYLYATLRWCDASETAFPPRLVERLRQLAAMGTPSGRSMTWPRKVPDVGTSPTLSTSWCNGAAGYVHLWTLSSRLLGNNECYERLARMAAWHSFEGAQDAPGCLCCGLAGRAYALLHLYRFTGHSVWLARARVLANQAVATPAVSPEQLNSLFHGDVGIALLAVDLECPEFSCMPFFEGEHWSRWQRSTENDNPVLQTAIADPGVELRRDRRST
jgi:serine/threonine protein kinase